jgi:hypothetical protein
MTRPMIEHRFSISLNNSIVFEPSKLHITSHISPQRDSLNPSAFLATANLAMQSRGVHRW